MLIILIQTADTLNAGDQSSSSMDRQMWPLLYMCGWTGMLSPMNVTCNDINVVLYAILL